MNHPQRKLKIGILGCGAIGSRIAMACHNELKDYCILSGIHDISDQKMSHLSANIGKPQLKKESLQDLLKTCDLMVEAVHSPKTQSLIQTALDLKKDVLAMSVGKLLGADHLFETALRNNCKILIPSGALAGIDAIQAASLADISSAVLTTRKPLRGFSDSDYLHKKNIRLSKIKKETLIFEGTVKEAVKHFPRNINVAATLALALHNKSDVKVRILTSPRFKNNSHEIEITGDFGKLKCRTENNVCPDNPKTSYLAILSGIQALKNYCQHIRVGT
jgi:aspartate dehydrogenase